jgi:hypothetical protein
MIMAAIKLHAGDMGKGSGTITIFQSAFTISAPWQAGDGFSTGKSYTHTKNDIESIDVATEESVKKIGGTVGWGVVGATLLGPVGLLAGLLLGGKGKDVTFVIKLKNGNKLLATTDSKTYTKLAAIVF